jgi:anti-anti-sigma regulatory factor
MMSAPKFQHISVKMVGEIAVVEILTKDLRGPKLGEELGAELAQVTPQEWAKRLLVDFRRTRYLSSTAFAVLFRLINRAKVEGRQVKLCNMAADLRVGADNVGLEKVVEICDSQEAGVGAYLQAEKRA